MVLSKRVKSQMLRVPRLICHVSTPTIKCSPSFKLQSKSDAIVLAFAFSFQPFFFSNGVRCQCLKKCRQALGVLPSPSERRIFKAYSICSSFGISGGGVENDGSAFVMGL